jgi:hypothetical protein
MPSTASRLPLASTYDAGRTIIVMHRPLHPRSRFCKPEDKPYPVTELPSDITPAALAERVAANDLECNRDDITAIFQIEDEGRSITNIIDAIFAGAEIIEAYAPRDRDDEGEAQQIGWDRERDRRAMAEA